MTRSRTAERFAPPPRADLAREAPFGLVRAAADDAPDDGRTLDGWAAVFNRETIIDSWEGRFREKLSPGSMKKSFREKPPRIQFDHGRHPLVGSIPIAQLSSVSEDTDPELAPDGGAHVVGRLMDNWLVEPVREAIAAGSIDGMSFRFSVVREAWFDADGKQIRDEDTLFDLLRRTWFEDVPDEELLLRDLREVKVAELGPVVWPAYADTSVAVRSTVIDLGRLDDPDTRKDLARAVFLADAAERMNDEDENDDAGEEPRTTDDPAPAEGEETPAGEHDEPASEDEPRSTEESSPAGEHPSTEAPAREAAPYMVGVDRGAPWYLPAPGSSGAI